MNTLTIADSGSWSLGALIWPPIALLLTVAFIVAAILARKWARREKGKRYGDYGPAIVVMIAAIVCAVLVVGGTAVGMYPYGGEYHQYREASGVVSKIDHRLIGTSDGMEDKFVVRFADSGQQFGCDDTRCAGVEVGDSLTLSCKRAWQYTGTDGYDCRFVSTKAAS